MRRTKPELIDNLGYRWEDCIDAIGKERLEEFADFMDGQTCPVSKEGKGLIYPSDFEDFLKGEIRTI